MRLHLPRALAETITSHAARAFPEECCGLIEGALEGADLRALALHESHNLADEPKRYFVIDPDVQFRLLRGLRGTGRDIIGCYHSHPVGAPAPSGTDLLGAAEDGFLWLVAGGTPDAGFTLKAYVFRESAFEAVETLP